MKPTTLEGLEGERLAAVADIWRRDRRLLSARFGGSSMLPAISPGAELTVACGDPVVVGDVAVLIVDGRVVVHRVGAVFQAQGRILTRGDATALPDLPVPLSSVVGRVAGLRAAGASGPVPPAPESAWRRAVLSVCLWLLSRWPAAGRAFVGGLWILRRWLVAYPAAAWRRLRRVGAGPVEEKDQAEAAEPARQ